MKVSGKRMKIDPEVPEQGAFLINGDKTSNSHFTVIPDICIA